MSIYEYDDFMKDLIYKFKGCFDYELKDVFLNNYLTYLSDKYKNFVLVPAPSYEEENIVRGFNHVIEIFKTLKIEIKEIFIKSQKHKQATSNVNERSQISSVIQLKETIPPIQKPILLVDDIMTTGSTLKRMIKLIKPLTKQKIEILVICKTILKPLA